MIRGSDLLDLPIFDYQDYKKPAYLKSFILNLYSRKIEALVIKKSMFTNNIFYLPVNCIRTIEKNKLEGELKTYHNPHYHEKDGKHYIDYEKLINKTIKIKDGSIIGIIRDIWINEIDWNYIGFEISEGYLDDLMNGRKLMSTDQDFSIEENNIKINEDLIAESFHKLT